MKFADIILSIRQLLDDVPSGGGTPLWSDFELAVYFHEGLVQFYKDTRLLRASMPLQLIIDPVTPTYALDPSIIYVERVKPPHRLPLTKLTREMLDTQVPDWENADPAPPRGFVSDLGSITIYPPPDNAHIYTLLVYRRPLYITPGTPTPTTAAVPFADGAINGDCTLEVPADYIKGPRFWALSQAYSKNDAETLRPQKIEDYLQQYMRTVESTKVELNLLRGADAVSCVHRGAL